MVNEEWRPGSFTKNFSWGSENGFIELFDSIRIGFDGELQEVSREDFRRRVAQLRRPDYIPINFFLFNRPRSGVDYLIVDELVFQAITSNHSDRFDKLALFSFCFSYAGMFSGSRAFQRRPALWATEYIKQRVANELNWDTRLVSADDIERFLINEPRYVAKGARKVATNLAHLFKIGRLSEVNSGRIDRWWVDALFLALDRLIEDLRLSKQSPADENLSDILLRSDFLPISGTNSIEKDLAIKHLVHLYIACGGRERFSEDAVANRTKVLVGEIEAWASSNDPDPVGALHPSNVRILKSVPAACAMLATYAGFEILSSTAMEEFNANAFIRDRTRIALDHLKLLGIEPTMSAEDLLKLTRGE